MDGGHNQIPRLCLMGCGRLFGPTVFRIAMGHCDFGMCPGGKCSMHVLIPRFPGISTSDFERPNGCESRALAPSTGQMPDILCLGLRFHGGCWTCVVSFSILRCTTLARAGGLPRCTHSTSRERLISIAVTECTAKETIDERHTHIQTHTDTHTHTHTHTQTDRHTLTQTQTHT